MELPSIHSRQPQQVNTLRFQLADLLKVEEEWTEAARVPLACRSRYGNHVDRHRHHPGLIMLPLDRFRVYVRILRLLLKDEDPETYCTTTDREIPLQFKQARISDYASTFLEAVMQYHTLSWVAEIDKEERKVIL